MVVRKVNADAIPTHIFRTHQESADIVSRVNYSSLISLSVFTGFPGRDK